MAQEQIWIGGASYWFNPMPKQMRDELAAEFYASAFIGDYRGQLQVGISVLNATLDAAAGVELGTRLMTARDPLHELHLIAAADHILTFSATCRRIDDPL